MEKENNYNPKVSIVIPTFERPSRLAGAVRSVLNQSYRNIEVLVVNDNIMGSFDDRATNEVLSRFNDERLRVLHTCGRIGGGAARNYCCLQATGDYLAFLDDDDEYLPDKIESQLRFMQRHDLEMSWQDVAWYNERGDLVEHRVLDHAAGYSQEELLRAHLLKPIAPTSIYMLTRELFNRTAGFGEVSTGQDWWLMLRCIELGAKIGYMHGVHVRQYLHSGARLSLGDNKIAGEEARHKVVQSYYHLLNSQEIRYIEFRHNAVLCVSCIRSRNAGLAMRYFVKAFKASPTSFVREGLHYLVKRKAD